MAQTLPRSASTSSSMWLGGAVRRALQLTCAMTLPWTGQPQFISHLEPTNAGFRAGAPMVHTSPLRDALNCDPAAQMELP